MPFDIKTLLPLSIFGGAKPMNAFFSPSKLLAGTVFAITLSGCVSETTPSSSSSIASSVIASSSEQAVSSIAESSEAMSSLASSIAMSSIAPSSEAASSSSIIVVISSSEASSSSSEVAVSSSIEASSSSEVVSSSSQESSVASSSSTSAGGEPDLVSGKAFYDNVNLQCVQCHGSTGLGGQFGAITPVSNNINTQAGLTQYLEDEMPLGDVDACTGKCASDMAAYILNGFSVNVANPNDHTIADKVTIAEAKSRAEKAVNEFNNANLTCNICHTPTDLQECVNCGSWNGLREFISGSMPPASGEVHPGLCTIENGCADRVTDYIWATVNGWTLTKKDGENGGIRLITESLEGNDTRRLKTYDMLSDDYTRIFGSIPSVLAGSKAAFKPAPEFWHTEGELGASALNVLVNAALQGCEGETLPAINEASLKNSCADWANRMWLRPATDTELQACADVALIDAAELNNTTTQAVYACVSVMVSLPAITF